MVIEQVDRTTVAQGPGVGAAPGAVRTNTQRTSRTGSAAPEYVRRNIVVNESPLAVCFPRDDAGFAERVRIHCDGSNSERPFAAAVQALLRETYPLAVISPRHEFAALDGRRVWYAFRDGSAMPHVDGHTS